MAMCQACSASFSRRPCPERCVCRRMFFSLSSSSAKALLIYSDNDALCRRTHYDILKEGLGEKENVSLVLVKGKGHNPNYTENAVKLLGEFTKARARLLKKKGLSSEDKERFVSSFDWNAMTEQDADIWSKIFEHLDGR